MTATTHPIAMPRLSDQMEEGTIISWLAAEGQTVAQGDELLEIETDKATMTYGAEHAGVLHIVVPEGATVAVGELIAHIGDGAHAPAGPPPDRAEPPVAARPANGGTRGAPHEGGGVPATPLARRVAGVHDVALGQVEGTGPRGRVTRHDVLRAAGIEPAVIPAAPDPAPSREERVPAAGGERVVRPTRLQEVAARRMSEQAAVPVFGVQTEVEMDAALALRAELRELAGAEPAPSINDLIVRACALALREHPLVNGCYRDGDHVLHDHIGVGIAIDTDAGLLVATVPDTDRLALGDLARASRELAQRVRAGRGTASELTGATFTVSNLGMFGMTQITPVINPPQAAILGVGATRPVLARDPAGEIAERTLLTLSLSGDHRILTGADGARFLADVRRRLEAPLSLAL
jgi:pyruvate dehydrogenase E2 component (dihydrolipoamide acetyltransferase)